MLLPETSTSTGAVKDAGQTLVWVQSPFLAGRALSLSALHSFQSTAACLAGSPQPERDGEQHEPLQGHSTKHPTLLGHMIVPGMAESTKHLYNLSLFFFQWTSGCTRGFTRCASLRIWALASTAIVSGTHFQGLTTYYQATADTDAHPLHTQGDTAQSPQLRFFPWRFDLKQWISDTDKEACPALTHPWPVHGQQTAIGLLFWWTGRSNQL